MPSYFAPFDLSFRDEDGYIAPLVGGVLKIRHFEGADITTVTADSYGFVKGVSISVDPGTEIEFYSETYSGTLRQTTAATLAETSLLISNFIVDDAVDSYQEATGGEIWLEDLSDPNIPIQYVAPIAPGGSLTIPYQSAVSKNVKLHLLSVSATGQSSDTDFTTTENATVAVTGGNSTAIYLSALLSAADNLETVIENLNDVDSEVGELIVDIPSPEVVEDAELNVFVSYINNGVWNVTDGAELTLNVGMQDVGNRQVFNCTDGGRAFVIGDYWNVAWWKGTDAETDADDAIEDIIASSLLSVGGGRAFVPVRYEIYEPHDIPSGLDFYSTGVNPADPDKCGGFDAMDDDAALKIGGNIRNCKIRDMVLCGVGTESKLIHPQGIYPNSTFGVQIDNVFFDGGDYGIYIESLAHGSGNPWEFMNGAVKNSYFIGQNVSHRWQNTNNNGIFGYNNYYAIDPGQISIDLQLSGTFVEDSSTAVGTGTPPVNALNTDGGVWVRYNGLFQKLKITNCQAENFQSFIKSGNNNYGQVEMVLENNLIQCYLDYSANASVKSRNNIYVNYNLPNFRNGNGWVGGVVNSLPIAVIVDSDGDTVDNRIDPTNKNLNGFTNPNGTQYSYILRQRNPGQEFITYKGYHHFEFATGAGGDLTKPVVRCAGLTDNKVYLGVGNLDSGGTFYGYLIYRKTDADLHFYCNQAPTFGGYNFHDGILKARSLSLTSGEGYTGNAAIGGALAVTGTSAFTGAATFAAAITANGGIQGTVGSFGDFAAVGKINAFANSGTLIAFGYSTSVYGTIQQNSTGTVTLDAVGATPKFAFADPVEVSGTLSITGVLNAVSGFQQNGTTLNTSHIGDTTNKRYVTDANLTVIGNTSGTNTGDETQSSINTKLGFSSSIGATFYTDGSGQIAQTANLFWDSANNQLSLKGSNNGLIFYNRSTNAQSVQLYSPSASDLRFYDMANPGDLVIINSSYARFNKSLQGQVGTSGVYGRAPFVLSKYYSTAGNASGSVEADLYSENIAANTLLASGDAIAFYYAGAFGSGFDAKNIKIYFGGNLIYDYAAAGGGVATGEAWTARGFIIRSGSSTATAVIEFLTNGFQDADNVALTGLSFASANNLKITGTCATANRVTANTGFIEYKPA